MNRTNRMRSVSLGLAALTCLSISLGQTPPSAAVTGSAYSAPVPFAIAPGALTTIFVQGLGNGITGVVQASGLPLPTKLSGISVSLRQTESPQGPLPVPILAVFPVQECRTAVFPSCGKLTGINIQVPFELIPNPSLVDPALSPTNYAQLVIQEDGGAQVTVEATPVFDRIHVLWTGDTLKNPAAANVTRPIPDFSSSKPIVTHADGSVVTAANPANVGETLVMYATGLGWMLPLPRSGAATPNPPPAGPARIAFDFTPDALPSLPVMYAKAPSFAGLTPGFAGLYQVNFVVPELPPGYNWRCGLVGTNLTVSIGVKTSFDGAGICVDIPGSQ